MSSRAQGRHRAAVRPKTPLTTMATQLQAQAGTAGRRGAVIAASSGLVVSLGVTAADAAPIGDATDEKPKAAQPAAPSTSPVAETEQAQITVAADVATAHVSPVATTLVAPPKPKPVATRSTAATLPSAARTALVVRRRLQDQGNLSASRANVMSVAARYVGTPYRYGGTTPSGFDCSGYVQYVFAQVGVSLPRTSSARPAAGVRISRSEAQPGDLVYKPGHVGIYAGGNMMYDSPTSGEVYVSKREIWSSEFGFYRVLDS